MVDITWSIHDRDAIAVTRENEINCQQFALQNNAPVPDAPGEQQDKVDEISEDLDDDHDNAAMIRL